MNTVLKTSAALMLMFLGSAHTDYAQVTEDTSIHKNNFFFLGKESRVNVNTPDDPKYVDVPAPTNVAFVWGVNPDYTSDPKDFVITSGQPWVDGVISLTDTNNTSLCTITVNAGRSNSKEPADFFINACSGGAMGGSDVFSKSPDKLNFAFVGTLSFDLEGTAYSFYVALGQGDQGAIHNWWVGGPEMLESLTPFPENVFASAGPIVDNQLFNIMASSVDTYEILPMFVPVPVPEPSTGGLALFGLALAGATFLRSCRVSNSVARAK